MSVDGERVAGQALDRRGGVLGTREGGVRSISVLTHGRAEETAAALARLVEQAGAAGVTLRFDAEEAYKHGLSAADGLQVVEPVSSESGGAAIEEQLCVVLGGDGTILRALRRYAGTDVPVFAINFGEIGFLATVDPEELEDGLRRALSGDFELLRLPAIVLETPGGEETAINDVAIHRRAGERVARLAYELEGEEVGSVRCDGLVIATPAGSTGYNLANGGPVMAWGVEGFVVSFIAPHSITARALVAAPSDRITIHNRSREALDVAVDGRPACELEAGGAITARFADAVGTIAQLPDSSFYRRLREKFGRLAR
jgi:NAD+ kinase